MKHENETPAPKPITFTEHGEGLAVNLERLLESRALIQANSGGGKSHALRQLLEETHGRVQHLVIDPEGEFSSLRERFDYVLVAVRGGDVVASTATAALLARRLVELGASAVIDISDLPATSPRGEKPKDRKEFVRLFLTELMALPRELWRPILVVVDEAHHFAPEKGHGESAATDAVIDLCTRGRKRGFCAVLATQRIAALSKGAVAELNNKLIGRTGLDVDVKRVTTELGLAAADAWAVLPKLAPGEFFAFGPAIANTVERVRTGKVITSHPKSGHLAKAPPPPPAKVKALLAQLADLPQEAEQHERTVEALERDLRSLRAELAAAKRAAPAPAKPIEVPVLTEEERKLLRSIAEDSQAALRGAAANIENLSATVQRALGRIAAAPQAPRPAPSNVQRELPAQPAPRPPPSGDTHFPRGARDMLTALAQTFLPSLSRGQVAMLAGLKAGSGTYSKYLSMLKCAGAVELRGDQLIITEAGLKVIGGRPPAPTTTEQIVATWRGKLPGGARLMLDQMVSAHPGIISREQLAERVGMAASSGTFSKYLSLLRTAGLVENSAGGLVASATLFPGRESTR